MHVILVPPLAVDIIAACMIVLAIDPLVKNVWRPFNNWLDRMARHRASKRSV
jgi:hypothetical protein